MIQTILITVFVGVSLTLMAFGSLMYLLYKRVTKEGDYYDEDNR